ncbi:ATP-dependent exonuclease [Tenacibaculum sp. SZ-18]|uniref:DUF3108 domain-containing protein n=1 Tax=Tenacibaculum sp. SZ-18 TaxID=754423 RepID=UPI000C2CF8DF|nr:DUF3108 domain-containing protein [Tenacibaculum sp. SZ-18]AUC16450.1 ATP-dependent exonuclease [Tenacibaculum sp. SZ-18]
MKIKIVLLLLVGISLSALSQETIPAFQHGEWLRYRMSYSGFLKAGEATLELREEIFQDKKVLHAIGKGKTSSVIGWFFKVRDTYESYFDPNDVRPYYFIRDIDEGGYKKKKNITFDHDKNTAHVKDLLKKKDTVISVTGPQDMISTFYFLRSYNTKNLKKGDEIYVDMFFDEKQYPFKLLFLGFETLNTKFGKVKTQMFRPLVQAGRVFKAKESVTVWITADDNKVPVKMSASLSVGSLRAELDAFKGLTNPFEIVVE